MKTWDLESVEEEEAVRKRAIATGQTIHLADFLATCSEECAELEPQYRTLKGRVCYRGDQEEIKPAQRRQLGTIPGDKCFASIDQCGKCHHSLRHDERLQDHLCRCGEGLSPKPTQFPCGDLGATSKRGVARILV